jgi:hypothetical protein
VAVPILERGGRTVSFLPRSVDDAPERLDELRRLLREALALGDREERMLAVAAVIENAAREVGLRPVLSGGLAAWAWTGAAEFATADIDLIAPTSTLLEQQLNALGFHGAGASSSTRRPSSSSSSRAASSPWAGGCGRSARPTIFR